MKKKLKTHRSLRRRMKVTGTGKVMRRKAGSTHLMSAKSTKKKRGLRKDATVAPAAAKKTKTLMGAH